MLKPVALSNTKRQHILFHGVILFIVMLIASACTGQSQESSIPEHLNNLQNLVVIQQNSLPETSVRFTRDLVINDNDSIKTWFNDVTSGGFAFGGSGWFAGLEVDDAGKIFIGDRYDNVIHIFDSTGNHLQRLGGEGRGPGEFTGILDIKIHSDQLFAFDYFQFRSTFFSLDSHDLIEVRDVYTNRTPDREELRGWPSRPVSLISDDLFIVSYKNEMKNANYGTENYNLDQEILVRYYVVDREGKIRSDMIDELKDMKNITAVVDGNHLFNLSPLPFLQQPMISISNEGYIYTANSDEPLIKMHNENGDYIKAFYIPIERRLIVRDEIIKQFAGDDKENTDLLLEAELPEKWPALSQIVIDDESNLWVSTISADNSQHEWLVIDKDGELITTFDWPSNEPIEAIKKGKMYTRQTDEETGLQQVVRYGIELREIE